MDLDQLREGRKAVKARPRRYIVKSQAKVRRALFILWIAAVCAVTAISVTPGDYLSRLDPASDKQEHMAAYLLLAGLGVLSFRRKRYGVLAAAGLVGLGLALEVVQSVVPGRAFEPGDMAANTVGVAVGSGIGLLLLRVFGRISGAGKTADAETWAGSRKDFGDR